MFQSLRVFASMKPLDSDKFEAYIDARFFILIKWIKEILNENGNYHLSDSDDVIKLC